MKRVAMWFFLSCKRYMRKWSFLFILLLLPLGVLAAGQAQKKGSRDVNIAISVEESGENALGNALADSLVNRPRGEDAGMFRFYLCRGEEEVKAEVASRRAECGYVIYAGLEEKLDAKSYKRSIGVYSAPSTVAAALSTETVFAALMKIYNGELLADYVAENELFDPLGTAGGESSRTGKEALRKMAGERFHLSVSVPVPGQRWRGQRRCRQPDRCISRQRPGGCLCVRHRAVWGCSHVR